MSTNNWKTQKNLAAELGVSIQVVNNWIRRKDARIKAKKDKVTGKILVCSN